MTCCAAWSGRCVAPRSPWRISQGFNPRPKIVFTLALALGIEGRREVVELELAEPMEPAEVLRRLGRVSPPGLDWLDAEAVAPAGRPAGRGGPVRPGGPRRPPGRRPIPPGRLAGKHAMAVHPAPARAVTLRSTSGRSCSEAELDRRLGVLLRFRLKMTPNGSRPARGSDRRPRPARSVGTGGRSGSHRSGTGPLTEVGPGR